VGEQEAEVAAAPGDGFAGTDEAMRDACYSALASRCGARHVEIEVEGQEKAAVGRGCDVGFELDELQA
jgi:hypothetical protein